MAPSAPVSFRWSKSETSTLDASVEDGTNDSAARGRWRAGEVGVGTSESTRMVSLLDDGGVNWIRRGEQVVEHRGKCQIRCAGFLDRLEHRSKGFAPWPSSESPAAARFRRDIAGDVGDVAGASAARRPFSAAVRSRTVVMIASRMRRSETPMSASYPMVNCDGQAVAQPHLLQSAAKMCPPGNIAGPVCQCRARGNDYGLDELRVHGSVRFSPRCQWLSSIPVIIP